MTTTRCAEPIAFSMLIDYWLGELGQAEETRVEEHLLGCGACTASAQQLADVAQGIRTLFTQGFVSAVVSDAFLERAASHGLRLREYAVPMGGSVQCTVGPDDDLLVTRLEAALDGVEQVDMLMLDTHGKGVERVRDIPFNAATGQVVMSPRTAAIRTLSAHTAQIRLLAIDREGERVIGEYTFHHSPWRSS